MNEREMQFRIGMFVIIAGLALTMLVIWFGESPTLLRKHSYLIVHYSEAPGAAEGIPVRKSGIRVGEVSSITFDERPGQPDGVLVTLSLDTKYHFKAGAVPRINRALMGDASIDLLPGTGLERLETSDSPQKAPIIEGTVAPDPSKALAAATTAFERVGDTLKLIDAAAEGISKVSKSADKVSEFLTTWKATGQRVSAAADGIDRFVRDNEKDFKPAVANLREVSRKLNDTLDPATQDALRSGIRQFATASTQLNTSLTSAAPLFKDLGAPVNSVPTTDFGQAVRRLNLITSDISALSQTLRGPDGTLNKEGTLQRLLTQKELYENVNRFAVSGTSVFEGFKPVIAAFRTFVERISRDPSALTRGALQR
jgi:phospholipid/cholesterol/gamma-HCH transport system substrate-binding protein